MPRIAPGRRKGRSAWARPAPAMKSNIGKSKQVVIRMGAISNATRNGNDSAIRRPAARSRRIRGPYPTLAAPSHDRHSRLDSRNFRAGRARSPPASPVRRQNDGHVRDAFWSKGRKRGLFLCALASRTGERQTNDGKGFLILRRRAEPPSRRTRETTWINLSRPRASRRALQRSSA